MTTIHERRFQKQRAKAKHRGIAWELTFDEWFGWWLDSGHYSERGCRRGQYVMARFGDVGPYALDNIMCISWNENVGNTDNTARPQNKPHMHCEQGHLLVGYNVIIYKNGDRRCRTCKQTWDREYKRQIYAADYAANREKILLRMRTAYAAKKSTTRSGI